MKSKKLIIKVVCIVLAVLILCLGVGLIVQSCNKKPAKRKVIKKVIVVQNDPSNTPTLPENFGVVDDPNSNFDGTYQRVRRQITLAKGYESPEYVPEYAVTEGDWAGPEGYVIVASKDVRASRDSAKRLQAYFLEKTGITLPCVTDETPETAKEILVGDTNRRTSSLKSTEFAVKVEGDKLVFEGGHYAMTDTAVDWFISFDYKAGKVNLLTGEIKDFLPSVNIEGKTLNYVWGDEHGGNKLNPSKWCFHSRMEGNADVNYIGEEMYPYIYVDEGQLKLNAGRYYDMFDTSKPYQTNISITSNKQMSYIYGYCEIRAKIPFKQGSWPSYWFNSHDSLRNRYSPAEGSGLRTLSMFIEIDFIEVIDKVSTPNLHKWYKTTSNRKAETGENHTYWEKYKKNGKIVSLKFSDLELASSQYMVHGMYWDAEQLSFYCDGEKYHTFDMTYNFDAPDYDGDAEYHFSESPIYPIINNTMYTPLGSTTTDKVRVDESQFPFEYYIDYSRYYQEQGVGELNLAVEDYR